jgi:AraC-like DNA-binding protein
MCLDPRLPSVPKGVTFRDYPLRVRLERAKLLLAVGHVSVTELAQIVGLGDLSRCDKVFKRYTDVTPSSFRSLALTCSNEEQRLDKKLLAAVEQVP